MLGLLAWQRGTTSRVALVAAAEAEPLVLNDASELSPTPVWKVLRIDRASGESRQAVLDGLSDARRAGRPAIASAARHSMGGQSMARDGLAISMEQDRVEPDPGRQTYRAGGGTRWSAVIRALDPLGFSPAVMQSNNDFGVASTFSVNAHGWPVPYPGCGATVRALEMILADGRAIRCSREENPEIFRGAMGGYGLFGVITGLELDMVRNRRLEPSYQEMPAAEFGLRFRDLAAGGDVAMAYGRLDVGHERFFDQALAIAYRPAADQDDLPPASGSGFMSRAARPLFRGQLGNERIKALRWWVETELEPRLGARAATRNSLLNEPVITLDDRDPTRTDILHEYFIAPERLAEFLAVCRDAIPNSYQQLLNVTLRFVRADRESLLSYAPGDRIAAVMLFSQEKSARAEADMARMTRLLIDGALAAGGSYYLPYRLHATQEQFEAAYPRAREFAALKRRVDPEGRFSNALWTTYLEGLA